MTRDTRQKAEQLLKGKSAIFDRYATGNNNKKTKIDDIDLNDLVRLGNAFFVASSFEYKRYEYGATLKDQNDYVYNRHDIYQQLFKHNYLEIKPDYKSFAFSNPTLRIIDFSLNKTTP